MASQSPDLRIDEEPSAIPSYASSPTTSDCSFVLQDEDFDRDIGKEKLHRSSAKVTKAMGENLPVHPKVLTSGRFESGFHSQTFYEYDDDLMWLEGLKAIDDFDWEQSAPECPRNQEEGIWEARPATSAVEASQLQALPSNYGSQIFPHSIPVSINCMETERSAKGEVSYSKSETAVPISESSFSPSHCGALFHPTLSPATPPATRKTSSGPPETSSLWIDSPPSKATIGPGTIIPTIPSEACDSFNSTGFLSAPITLPGDAIEPDPMSPDSMDVDKTLGAEGAQEVVEGARESLAQFVATQEQVTPPSHAPDRVVIPNNTTMDLFDDHIQDEGLSKVNEESIEEVQYQLSSNGAEKTGSTDLDSLFDGDNGEETGQGQQPHGQQIDAVYPGTETEKQLDIPALAPPVHARKIVSQSSEPVENYAPIQPSSLKDDIGSQTVEKFDLEEPASPLLTPLEDTGDVSTAAEALILLSNTAETASICRRTTSSEVHSDADNKSCPIIEDCSPTTPSQAKPPSRSPGLSPQLLDQRVSERDPSGKETHVEDTEEEVTFRQAAVDAGGNSNHPSQVASPVSLSFRKPPTSDAALEAQSPRSKDTTQLFSPDVTLPKDAHSVNKYGATAEPEMVAAPIEEPAVTSTPNPETRSRPFKLNIASYFWNVASPILRGGTKYDKNAVGNIPAASTSTPGDAGNEPQENHDALDRSEAKSLAIMDEDSRGPAESSDVPSLVDESPLVPASPDEEGTPSDIRESTPQILLPGLEEHAGAASSSTIAPTSPEMELQDQSSSWRGKLPEQELELPPSPYEAEPTTSGLPGKACDPDLAQSETTKASLSDNTDSEPIDSPLPVPKQDTPHDASGIPPASSKAIGTLPPPGFPTFENDEPFQSESETKTPKIVAKKRAHPAAIKKTRVSPNPNAEFKVEEDSGSDYQTPAKKKSKKRGSTMLSLQTRTSTYRGKGNTKLSAPPKDQRRSKATQQMVEKQVVEREDTEAEEQKQEQEQVSDIPPTTPASTRDPTSQPRYWALETRYGKRVTRGDVQPGREDALADTSPLQGVDQPHDEEENLVDVDPNPDTDNTESASKTKGVAKTKKIAPAKLPTPKPTAKTPATPKPAAPTVPPRSARSKPLASATPPAPLPSTSAPDAGLQRKKFGFKPPTGRKRKSTDAIDGPASPPGPPGQTQTTRKTRMASAAQEERERQAEIEQNVAKRTRGARKSTG